VATVTMIRYSHAVRVQVTSDFRDLCRRCRGCGGRFFIRSGRAKAPKPNEKDAQRNYPGGSTARLLCKASRRIEVCKLSSDAETGKVPAFGLRDFPFYPRPYGSSTWHNVNYLSTQDIVLVMNSQNASVYYVITPSKRPAEALPVFLCEDSHATRTGFNEQSSGLSRLVISPAALPLATRLLLPPRRRSRCASNGSTSSASAT